MTHWLVEFLNDTVEAEFDSFPVEVKAKTVHISNLIREFGLPNIGMPYVKHVQDKIWEIRAAGKSEQGRCLYVATVGKRVVILRCFLKKTQKLPRKELAIALNRAKELSNG
ncbi:MAG: type II toxin-antitoxin system RelE/ParE family toxin [Desulfovibrionales bacterium]|nr:MAG: type II toxin-antitoxin system RelE/ParE family toxin [Desulfovibrionales bacterium]